MKKMSVSIIALFFITGAMGLFAQQVVDNTGGQVPASSIRFVEFTSAGKSITNPLYGAQGVVIANLSDKNVIVMVLVVNEYDGNIVTSSATERIPAHLNKNITLDMPINAQQLRGCTAVINIMGTY